MYLTEKCKDMGEDRRMGSTSYVTESIRDIHQSMHSLLVCGKPHLAFPWLCFSTLSCQAPPCVVLASLDVLYWNGQLVWTPALGL